MLRYDVCDVIDDIGNDSDMVFYGLLSAKEYEYESEVIEFFSV